MKSKIIYFKRRATTSIVAALLLYLNLPSAYAQAMEGGAAGLGSGEDAMLPPEVVPLDPQAAGKLAQSEIAARQAQMKAEQAPARAAVAEGNSFNGVNENGGGMQSAQDARKAAFNQLMGQSQTPALNKAFQYQNQTQFMPAGQPGASGSYGPGFNPAYQGQPVASNYTAPGGPAGQTGQSGWIQPGQGGTQTLTGGVAYQPTRQSIRRGGFTNAISAITGLGAGLFLGSMVGRGMYSSPMGLGMYGLGMTGFGMRNGFRW